MAKHDELSSESDAIESTEGTPLAARFQALLSVAESISSCREPEELFGPGEFELRDRLHSLGAMLVEEAVNEQAKSKKGVLGC